MDSKNKKLLVAYIMPSLDAGGAERFLLDLVLNLDQKRFTPHIILFHHAGFWVEEARAKGIKVTVLRKYFKIDPWNFLRLLRLVKNLKPDIIHTQLGGDVYGRLAAKILGIKAVVSTEQNVNPRESKLLTFTKLISARYAAKLVAISEAVRDDMVSRYALEAKNIEIIYNGVNPERFASQPLPQPRAGRPLVIGSVGRLTPQKNFSLLLKALARLPFDLRCIIVGEGELRAELEAEAISLKIAEKVSFPGLSNKIPEFLYGLDIFVLPSRWEGLGVILLEAGLANRPIVASDVDGIKEIISDGQTGTLFHSENIDDLTNKIKLVAENLESPEIKNQSDKLRQEIIAKFSIQSVAKKYQNIYEDIISK